VLSLKIKVWFRQIVQKQGSIGSIRTSLYNQALTRFIREEQYGSDALTFRTLAIDVTFRTLYYPKRSK
jgi:hypothetical protein